MDDLSSHNPHGRFSDRAEDYARYRPSYPAAAIDFILAGLGTASELEIADVGAGTGISSRLLAERGAHVIAIDPNVTMLGAAQRDSRVRYQDGRAERTALPSSSIDLVTAFQAFHWFSKNETMREFRRILKRPGRAALVWNNRERNNAFNAAYAALVETFGREAAVIDRGTNLAPPDQTLAAHGFRSVERRVFSYEQKLGLEGLVGRARSSSYFPREGPEYERLSSELRAIFEQFAGGGGHIRLLYRTVVYRGELT